MTNASLYGVMAEATATGRGATPAGRQADLLAFVLADGPMSARATVGGVLFNAAEWIDVRLLNAGLVTDPEAAGDPAIIKAMAAVNERGIGLVVYLRETH